MNSKVSKRSTKADWVWIDKRILTAVHEEQLAEHGGAVGTRDEGLFDSALARPINLAAYGSPDVADLAASYAVGLAKNHPFVDGNKRTAFVAMELFLALNGAELTADDVDCVMTTLDVAAGKIDEAALADWIRKRSQPECP
jgi:death on curing protein